MLNTHVLLGGIEMGGNRTYSREFRMHVVRRMIDGEKVADLSLELGIHRKLLYEWQRQVSEGGAANLRERGRPRKSDAAGRVAVSAPRQVAALERRLAQMQRAVAFLRHVLQESEAVSTGKIAWRDSIFRSIQDMMRQPGGLDVKAMCQLARVTRSGYYRYLRAHAAAAVAEGDD